MYATPERLELITNYPYERRCEKCLMGFETVEDKKAHYGKNFFGHFYNRPDLDVKSPITIL